MPISTVLGLLAALIGSTATLLAAWVYIRSQRPPKQELFRTGLIVIIIMVSILGLAVLISRATSLSINGQEIVPVPGVPTSVSTSIPVSTPIPGSTPTAGLTPTPTAGLTPTPTAGLTPTPTAGLTPTPTAGLTPTSAPTSTPAPTP
jgi:hypothetical protein